MGENAPPGGDFRRSGGDFVIYEIWGAISASRGAIAAGWNVLQFESIPKNNFCHFGIKTFDVLSTLGFVTKFIEHMIWHW